MTGGTNEARKGDRIGEMKLRVKRWEKRGRKGREAEWTWKG